MPSLQLVLSATVHRRYRSGSGWVKYLAYVKQICQHVRIVIHSVSIHVSSSHPEIFIRHLYKILIRIHVAIIIISLGFQIFIFLIASVLSAVINICSESKDNNICSANKRINVLFEIL